MSLLNKIGDLYHKHVYRHLTKGTAKITDTTNFCFSDLILAPYVVIHELLAVGVGSTVWKYVNSESTTEVTNSLTYLLSGLALGGGVIMTTFLFNLARTPLEKKLDLKPVKLDYDKEVTYTIQKLNGLSDSEPLTLEQVAKRINQPLDDLVEGIEGYKVKHGRKVKVSYFHKQLSHRIQGVTTPLFHEAVMTVPSFLEFIAHEKAHQAGYLREHEAQYLGYVSMHGSGDRSLQYLAYRQRLMLLLDQNVYGNLEKLGLNSRTREEIDETLNQVFGKKLSWYGKLKLKIDTSFRNLILKSTSQKNIEEAYYNKPLSLISAYDPPKSN